MAKTQAWVLDTLQARALAYSNTGHQIHFGHATARALFGFSFHPRVLVFQVAKGGTGKTSLARESAIRASLYGARVLCVDMDPQANLTTAFNQNADQLPVMIDVLADQYPLKDTIISVLPGVDLLPSRFDNTLLDQVIIQKGLALDSLYRGPLQALKKSYDLIIVDCPPSLGQSVAACALAADVLVVPVAPQSFAMAGLKTVYQSLLELEEVFGLAIPFLILLNQFDPRARLSQQTLALLLQDPHYGECLIDRCIRDSQEFPKAIAAGKSIFDALKPSGAKNDIDHITKVFLDLVWSPVAKPSSKASSTIQKSSISEAASTG